MYLIATQRRLASCRRGTARAISVPGDGPSRPLCHVGLRDPRPPRRSHHHGFATDGLARHHWVERSLSSRSRCSRLMSAIPEAIAQESLAGKVSASASSSSASIRSREVGGIVGPGLIEVCVSGLFEVRVMERLRWRWTRSSRCTCGVLAPYSEWWAPTLTCDAGTARRKRILERLGVRDICCAS